MPNTADYLRRAILIVLVRRGMTQRDLAKKLGRSDTWVSYRLTGAADLNFAVLDLIASALEMTVFDLVEIAKQEKATAEHAAESVAS